jgi:hypothetical protein
VSNARSATRVNSASETCLLAAESTAYGTRPVCQARGTPSVQQPLTAGLYPVMGFEVVVRQNARAEPGWLTTTAAMKARARRTPVE